jgi:hypothetical protein
MAPSEDFNVHLQESHITYSTFETKHSILIAVCTLGKNQNLNELIRQLIILKNISVHRIRIIIIWNSNQEIDRSLSSKIEIFKQTKIGYATSRNEALKQRQFTENLLFIDDDEILEIGANEGNIEKLKLIDVYLQAAKQYPESIFVGPYYPVDSEGLRKLVPWKKLPERNYGETIQFASGGNLFLPATIMNKFDIVFDSFFDFGGEDTKFASDFLRLGIVTRWVPDAFLYEITPDERYSKEWQDERHTKNFLINIIIGIQNRKNHRSKSLFEALKILAFFMARREQNFLYILDFKTKELILKSILFENPDSIRAIVVRGVSSA